VIERLNNEPQRRIHGALPDALLRLELAGAVLVEARSELHVGERSYLSECAIVLLADSTEIRNEVATLASFTA
jgi:hypothetical protein